MFSRVSRVVRRATVSNSRVTTEMSELSEQLKVRWESEGASTRPGISQRKISAFEARYGVHIPEDFRDYFCTVDGMEEGLSENALISFWPLNKVEPVTRRVVEHSGVPDYSQIARKLKDAGSYFAFADFLIWSHVYAIRIGAPHEKNEIVWICGSHHSVIADSFSAFIRAYLKDPNDVLCPAPLRRGRISYALHRMLGRV